MRRSRQFTGPLWVIALTCLGLMWTTPSMAQRQRAVLVGINDYAPPAGTNSSDSVRRLSNLDGPLNDVAGMKQVLVARWGFAPGDIVVLQNAQATAAAIRQALNKQLVASSQKGDVAFFFFAGHGSQVRNKSSDEADGMDETLVPADAYRGTPDLRDKELRDIYNAVIDKGAHLTVVLDACHSGSSWRGPKPARRARFAPPSKRAIDQAPTKKTLSPSRRGALIFAAARAHQLAHEARVDQASYGAFTWALLRTLRSAPTDSPAQRLFEQARAYLKGDGYTQEPAIAATSARRKLTFLGRTPGKAVLGQLRVAVVGTTSAGEVELQGGRVLGIVQGCELRGQGAAKGARLKVVRSKGLTTSFAKLMPGGPASVPKGSWLTPVKWTAGSGVSFGYWTGDYEASPKLLRQAATRFARLVGHASVTVDPTKDVPTHILTWTAAGWALRLPGSDDVRVLGKHPSAKKVLKAVAKHPAKGPRGKTLPARLFIDWPAPKGLAKALTASLGADRSIRPASARRFANYELRGVLGKRGVAYHWSSPGATEAKRQAGEVFVSRTDPIPIGGKTPASQGADGLAQLLTKLYRLQAWLNLASPPGQDRFPYDLAVVDASDKGMTPVSELVGGRSYRLVLRRRPGGGTGPVQRRYAYVFVVASDGSGVLQYPLPGQVPDPVPSVAQIAQKTEWISLGTPQDTIDIVEPFGLDAYMLLTTDRALVSADEVLNWTGVRTRTGVHGGGDLERLLLTTGSRRWKQRVPPGWSIQQLLRVSRSPAK